MVSRTELAAYLDKELEIRSIEDTCTNGMQVEGKDDVKVVGFCVDVTLKTLQEAADKNVDFLISHHGLIWKPVPTVTGIFARRLSILMRHGISLYTAHLPMDIHKRYSHGRLLAEEIGLHGIDEFGCDDLPLIGVSGSLRKPLTIDALKGLIDAKLSTAAIAKAFGPEQISSVGIVSGSGGFTIQNAARRGLHCLITGEAKHNEVLLAKDLGVSLIIAGHAETERLGLLRLSTLLTKKFKIQSFFFES